MGQFFAPVFNFKYDYAGRRIEKRVVNIDSSAELLARRFVYDGWNLVLELDGAGSAIQRSYSWGLDRWGGLTGSGGPGGLLQITYYNSGAPGNSYYPTYDANGNVTSLVRASDGFLAAIYEYDPFGRHTRNESPDPAVADNPFRWATRWRDEETDLYYYGHRYYSAEMGRWINKDPIGETGGLNLYGFVGNNPVNLNDYLGWSTEGDLARVFNLGDSNWLDTSWDGTVGSSEGTASDGLLNSRDWRTPTTPYDVRFRGFPNDPLDPFGGMDDLDWFDLANEEIANTPVEEQPPPETEPPIGPPTVADPPVIRPEPPVVTPPTDQPPTVATPDPPATPPVVVTPSTTPTVVAAAAGTYPRIPQPTEEQIEHICKFVEQHFRVYHPGEPEKAAELRRRIAQAFLYRLKDGSLPDAHIEFMVLLRRAVVEGGWKGYRDLSFGGADLNFPEPARLVTIEDRSRYSDRGRREAEEIAALFHELLHAMDRVLQSKFVGPLRHNQIWQMDGQILKDLGYPMHPKSATIEKLIEKGLEKRYKPPQE